MPEARIAIVAGSGIDLSGLLNGTGTSYSFRDFPELHDATIAGHPGRFVFGTLNGMPIVVQEGRLHFYEGLDYAAVTGVVDQLRDFGVERVVFTNAAGGLEAGMNAGHLMAAATLRAWPCALWPEAPETHALDFTIPGCDSAGTYLWVHGPCYETRAEIQAMQHLGVDAVGMSTLPEAVRCAELGMECAAISCVTNNCCTPQHLTHEHVVATAQRASERLTRILRDALNERVGV